MEELKQEDWEVQTTFNEIDIREDVEEIDGGDEGEATDNITEQK